jgi:hypothetical protein
MDYLPPETTDTPQPRIVIQEPCTRIMLRDPYTFSRTSKPVGYFYEISS